VEPLQSTDPAHVGPYRLAARLGAGGMGRVYLAHSSAGRRVAVKVVHARFAADPGFRARFRREVAAARAVGGVFTASIVDADPEATSPWLATEYVAGPSLHAAVAEHGPFAVPEAERLGAALADALVAIHRSGVVHRDLKPANVLLGADGPRVIDFGIAHPADGTRITAAGGMIGSPGYMAPEQLMGPDGPTGPATDVFALGAVLVYATTGEGPFGRAAVPVLLYRLGHEEPRLDALPDAALRDLVAHCLRREPAARPTATAVLDALTARLQRAAPTGAWPPPAVAADITRVERELPAPPPPATSRRRVLIGAALGVATAAGGGVAALVLNSREDPAPAPVAAPPTSAPVTAVAGPRAGQQRWAAKLGTFINAGAAAGPELVYAGAKETVRALDRGTGEQRWSSPGDGEFRAVIALTADALYVGNADGHVYALDPATGERRWRRQVGEYADTDPVVVGNAVYAVGFPLSGSQHTGDVVALDAASGARRWSRTFPTRRKTVHVAGDTVLVAATDALVALDAASGAERWRRPLAEPSPAVSAAGTAYCGDKTGTLHALDLQTGDVQWTTSASPDELRLTPWLDPADGRIYLCDGAGNLVMVDPAQRATGWQFAAGASNPPVVRAGRAVVSGNRAVHAVDTATGRPQWRFDTPAYLDDLVRPAVTDDSVYFGDTEGGFFALDVAGGTAPAPG
jgi:outer membrane protein assembly factor BamB